MPKKLKEGDEVLLRVVVKTIWPSKEVTIFIKSASAGGLVTLLDDRDIEEPKRDRLV